MKKPFLATVGIFLACSAWADIIYVDINAAGNNDGSRWEDAFNDPQDAVTAANNGDEVWVAAGTYLPDSTPNGTSYPARGFHFSLKNGVALYGGFAGGETLLSERDISANETILSGDIGMPGDDSDNCLNVFYHPAGTNLDATAVLDGFTVTGGKADVIGSPCGGGIYNYASSPTIRNCSFISNTAGEDGGAIANDSNSSPAVSNCFFTGNSAYGSGGGIHNQGSSPTVNGCAFVGNTAYSGGGMSNNNGSVGTVTNSFFVNNRANYSGGGVSNLWTGAPTFINCALAGNTADYGAGMANHFATYPTVINCTFTRNHANIRGGGMENYDTVTDATVTNCVFWGNGADIDASELSSVATEPVVSYCNIEGGLGGAGCAGTHTDGGNNLNADPKFANGGFYAGVDDTFGTADDGLRLLVGSGCLNTGNNAANGTGTDIKGGARIQETTIDIGSYEGATDFLHAHFAVGRGSGSIDGAASQTVTVGGNCTEVLALPDLGYHFVDWTDDHDAEFSIAPAMTLTNVQQDTRLHANFEINQFRVTFVEGANGSITGDLVQTIDHGSDCTVVAPVPDCGHHFLEWIGDYAGTDNPLTVTGVTGPMAITAIFGLNLVEIMADQGAVDVPEGGTATFSLRLGAQPVADTLVEVGWQSGDADITVSGGDALTFTTATWDQWQTVTLAATEDDDASEGMAMISCGASGIAPLVITATEAENDYLLTVLDDGNGTTDPAGAAVRTKGAPASIAAEPAIGHHFDAWTLVSGAAAIADPVQASTTVTASEAVTVLANFAINEYTVTFTTDGTEGASLAGALVQTVTHGSDCTPVLAVPPTGHGFLGWIGDHLAADNPLTVTNVVSDMAITACFKMDQVACGSTFILAAEDVSLTVFKAKPKLYAHYDLNGKQGKAAAKVLTVLDKENGNATLACEWTKKLRLSDLKAFKASEAGGIGAADWITDTTMADLVLDLRLASKEVADRSVQPLALAVPVIANIADGGKDAKENDLLVITGQWFGTKKPKVWREYRIPGKVEGTFIIKRQAMKVVKPTEADALLGFKDSKDKPAHMNPETGASKVVVIAPAKQPKGLPNGTVVLDNGVGLAAGGVAVGDAPKE